MKRLELEVSLDEEDQVKTYVVQCDQREARAYEVSRGGMSVAKAGEDRPLHMIAWFAWRKMTRTGMIRPMSWEDFDDICLSVEPVEDESEEDDGEPVPTQTDQSPD